MQQIKFSEMNEGYIFQSYKNYAIEFEDETILNHVQSSLGTYFQKVSSTVGIINYKNYVGISQLINKQIRVESNKISPELYELMIKEVVEKTAQLPFDFNSPTYEYFEIRDQTDKHVLYHLYLILKYIFFDADVSLQSALENIVWNPSRKHIYESKRSEISNIDKVSNHILNSILSNPQWLEKVPSHNSVNQTMLAKRIKDKSGKSYFPIYADSIELNNSFDTLENRFVKLFLFLAKDIIEKFLTVIKSKKGILNQKEIIDNCTYIQGSLDEWLLHDIFINVGEMNQLPFNSVILHQREGYKEVFQFYNMLYSSLQLPFSSQQITSIIENKNIAELYEIWTFFKTLNVIEETYNIVPESAFVVHSDEVKSYLKNSMNVSYKLDNEQLIVWYNKTFTMGKGSYSLTLRPDTVIEYKGKKYIFDAKFKLDNLRWDDESDDDLQVVSSITFKNSDIYKMHTYKDAISAVSIACILYPNDTTSNIKFFKDGIHNYGVGAIPLLPTSKVDEFKSFLKRYIP